MPGQSAHDHSLSGRIFDQYQNLMQIARCVREAARQSAIAHPRVLELSRRHTTLQDYLPEAKMARYATHQAGLPTLTIPVTLPFPDRSYDICIVSDNYEHLPSELRPALLGEMMRVTDGLVLVGCPIRDELVTRFDRIVFDFIWGKYGEQFLPLRQHELFGLESLEEVLASLTAQGARGAVALPSNYVYRWIHQILIYFDLQHLNPHQDLYEAINRIYNERLAQYDYREPCYHYLIAVATDPRLNLDLLVERLSGPCETPSIVAETEGTLVEAFHAAESEASDRLRASAEIIAQLSRNGEWAAREIARLNALLTRGQRRREWVLRKVKRLVTSIRRIRTTS